MNSTTSTPVLPNPFTPMAFLPPDIAYQNMVATHVYVGTLAVSPAFILVTREAEPSCELKVLIWDILNNARHDLFAVFAYPVKVPSVVYLISRSAWVVFFNSVGILKKFCYRERSAAFTFSLCTVIYQTAAVSIPCSKFCRIIDWLFAVAVASTALLFLIRVLAIFERSKPVRIFFCVMWLAVLAGVLAPSQGLAGDNIGPTKHCINVKIETYVGIAGIIPLVNDTLVFLAISWRLARISYASNPLSGGVAAFFRGDYLPAFSRGLLQDGQIYYLTTVTTSLLTVIVFYFPLIPVVYRAMFAVPNAALMNIMACRVYRRTKSGQYYRKESHNISTNLGSSKANDAFIPLSFAGKRNGMPDLAMKGIANSHGDVVEVVKTGPVEHDGPEYDKRRGYGRGTDASTIV
ncbi:hypothetical protein NLJ89_g8081 [Agrocybe chaxingu]|uniref:Uncharacterized protein n=1 Tax=Agrocybe chaxingu TaxID=84603 RepID=A0A9W8MR46_9AGAR|nr:hypothetical protein NLJ89_g8081 [Agrocybe chaxingu]